MTFFFFFFTLVTGPTRSLSLKLSDITVYEPQIRARLGTTAHFCKRGMTGRVFVGVPGRMLDVVDLELVDEARFKPIYVF